VVTKKFGRRYPWAGWFGRGRFRLRRGVDFNGRADTMAAQVRRAAREAGVGVRVAISADGESLAVTVTRGGGRAD
jgi:hypothetical protein